MRAYRRDFPGEFASTRVRVFVTRNANAPSFQHGNLVYSLSEDQSLGLSFGGVSAVDPDLVGFS